MFKSHRQKAHSSNRNPIQIAIEKSDKVKGSPKHSYCPASVVGHVAHNGHQSLTFTIKMESFRLALHHPGFTWSPHSLTCKFTQVSLKSYLLTLSGAGGSQAPPGHTAPHQTPETPMRSACHTREHLCLCPVLKGPPLPLIPRGVGELRL